MTRASTRQLLLHLAANAFLFISTLALFSSVRNHALLQWDDQLHLTQNPFLQPGQPDRYLHFWRTPYAKLYVPVMYNVWAALYAHCFDAGGTFSPWLLHVANLVAHAIAAVLSYLLLARLLKAIQREMTPVRIELSAFFGAALFAWHPLQAEAVAWISELRGLLAADFAIAAMLVYVIGVSSERGALRIVCAIGGPLLLALAALSKPSVATVPLMLLVLDRFWLERTWRQVIVSLLPWFAISLASLVLMRSLQAGGTPMAVALWRRPFVAGDAVSFYLGRFVWPFDLAADYSRTPVLAAHSSWFWWACIVPVVIAALLAWRRPRAVIVAFGLFLAALLPVLGFVPFAFQRISTVADRYAYLALLGPAFALALILSRATVHTRQAFASATIVLTLLGLRTRDQLDAWRDDTTLWQHAIAVNPDSLVGLSNVGESLRLKGDRVGARRLYDRVIALSPTHEGALFGLASLSADAGDFETARATYDRAAQLNEDEPSVVAQALDGAGFMFVRLGRPDDAEQRYRAALAADPTFANGHNDLGALLLDHNRAAEAREQFEKALDQMPTHPLALVNLAAALDATGDHAAADRALHHAADLLPHEVTPRKRLARRAMDARDWPTAIEWLSQALAIDPSDADALNELGQCQAATGKIEEAITSFERAIALRPDLSALRENLEAAKSLRKPSRP